MLKSQFLWIGVLANMLAATFMFVMGSLMPYLQLYNYRSSLASGDLQQIYAMQPAIMQIKTSASAYICKDVAKRVSVNFEKPTFFESAVQHCGAVLNTKEDSITYALIGRLNAVAWKSTKVHEYYLNAQRYFSLSSDASPQNENAQKIIAEGRLYIQLN